MNLCEPIETILYLQEPQPDCFLLAGRYTLLDHSLALQRVMPNLFIAVASTRQPHRRRASDCGIGPLPLRLDTEVSRPPQSDFDGPAEDEPGEHVRGAGVSIGGEARLWPAAIGGISDGGRVDVRLGLASKIKT